MSGPGSLSSRPPSFRSLFRKRKFTHPILSHGRGNGKRGQKKKRHPFASIETTSRRADPEHLGHGCGMDLRGKRVSVACLADDERVSQSPSGHVPHVVCAPWPFSASAVPAVEPRMPSPVGPLEVDAGGKSNSGLAAQMWPLWRKVVAQIRRYEQATRTARK